MGRDGTGVELREKSIRVSFTYQGKRVRETLNIAPTPANARHAARLVTQVKRAISNGTFSFAEFFPDSPRAATSQDGKTFGQMCEIWLRTKGLLADKTKAQYRNALEVWIGLLGADTPINLIPHSTIADKVGSTPWASAKLLNNYLIPLRGVFTLAQRDMKIENPLDGIGNAKHQSPPPDPLTPSEMSSVLRIMAERFDPRVSHYFSFAFATGMRPEEIIALTWADIDWNHETASVSKAKTAGKVKPLKTYTSRDVDLLESAINALRGMKQWTFANGPDAPIFQNPVTGRPWHDERSQRDHYWTVALRKLGIRHRRAYNTRHTYATIALAQGVNPAYISRQLGHTNARMLFTVYAKWIDGADRGREKAKMQSAHSSRDIPGDIQWEKRGPAGA